MIVGFRWPYHTGPDTQPLAEKIGNLRRYADEVIGQGPELTGNLRVEPPVKSFLASDQARGVTLPPAAGGTRRKAVTVARFWRTLTRRRADGPARKRRAPRWRITRRPTSGRAIPDRRTSARGSRLGRRGAARPGLADSGPDDAESIRPGPGGTRLLADRGRTRPGRRSRPESARPQPPDAALWLRDHGVTLVAVALIARQLWWAAVLLGHSYFRQDDFLQLRPRAGRGLHLELPDAGGRGPPGAARLRHVLGAGPRRAVQLAADRGGHPGPGLAAASGGPAADAADAVRQPRGHPGPAHRVPVQPAVAGRRWPGGRWPSRTSRWPWRIFLAVHAHVRYLRDAAGCATRWPPPAGCCSA